MQPLLDLLPEVLALASRTDSSAYDLFYLALAQRTGATLLTADLALRKAALGIGIDAPA
jgi:predicted nucleic acid-binding protein